jgi:hypothetical protein
MADPEPLFAQIGTGAIAVIVVLLAAMASKWTYDYFRESLPH